MSQTACILIVEDEEYLSKPLADSFKSAGYDVTVAADGPTGLKQALDIKPTVMLLDVQLPGLDGLEVLRQLRQDEFGKNLPVVILTNDSQNDRILEGYKEQVAAYLIKAETSLETIVKVVSDLVRQ